MPATLDRLRGLAIIAALAVAVGLWGPAAVVAQQTGVVPRDGGAQATGKNPTAESVNEEALFKQSGKIQGVVTIPDWKASVLEQPQGRDWRGFHEGAIPWLAGIAFVGMVGLLTVFFLIRGRIRLEPGELTGRLIVRFNALERLAHWLTASALSCSPCPGSITSSASACCSR